VRLDPNLTRRSCCVAQLKAELETLKGQMEVSTKVSCDQRSVEIRALRLTFCLFAQLIKTSEACET
jgi:hypothetical protein